MDRSTASRSSLTQTIREIAVNTSHLQSCPGQRFTHFRERSIAESRVIAQENKIDQPLSLEELHCLRMNIGPPIVCAEIVRYQGGRMKGNGLSCLNRKIGNHGQQIV